jgi:hypothetical protein
MELWSPLTIFNCIEGHESLDADSLYLLQQLKAASLIPMVTMEHTAHHLAQMELEVRMGE